MKKIILPAIILFLAGSGFFAYTYYEWRHFSPEIEVVFPVADENTAAVPLPHRRGSVRIYSNPFFPSDPDETSTRGSRLILRGTLIGPDSLALVESQDRPGESRIVREGDTVLEEKILSIHEGWITVLVNEAETVILRMEEPN